MREKIALYKETFTVADFDCSNSWISFKRRHT